MSAKASYAISTYALFDQPLREAIQRLADGGWTSIEIMCEAGHRELLEWSAGELNDLRALGSEKGIVWSIHAPIDGCNPAAAGGLREQTSDAMKRCLEVAAFLDCTHVVMHAGEVEDRLDGAERERGVERVAQFIEPLLPHIGSSRTRLLLENVPPYPKVLGWTVSDLIAICKQVASPSVGIVYDIGHAHLIRKGYALDGLREVFPYMQALHLSDNRGIKDDHLAVGEGTVPFAAILSLLKEKGFAGSWVIETTCVADAELSISRLSQQR
ncbi:MULTISPECIES: sugar phosphate isomerase/epimerase family protein [Brevibacillus]|uniref:sugar phosphate isomerase/epimerase family protein n=1 Tax=Brevibacillus TaxID=55080 RepID=UPI00203DEDF8|nr:sugar phosphate isomerase/epimerase family protein [Brevibacillus borstelensis]MCM3472012.1 sugar phosphate isomerase/epimerase [Brevibacillus borstelensis]MED2008971.1 sugar phosphate isomerase/epimerase [Brevibacillus borstelensis]